MPFSGLAQNVRLLYIGQCEAGLPHGRGLLLSPEKGIEGAKAERGEVYQRAAVSTMQGLQAYAARADYLLAFQRTQWTEDNFGGQRMPGPTASAVLPHVNSFLSAWGDRDPDQLAPRAREAAERARLRAQGITWAYLHAQGYSTHIAQALREWKSASSPERLAEAEALYRQRWRQEYDSEFANIASESSAERFVGTYAANDPDRRVPKARELQAKYAAEIARERQARDAARSAKAAREAANPVCMAQKRTCEAQCEGMSDRGLNSPRSDCRFQCSLIRCD
jgi:hypothetical protein